MSSFLDTLLWRDPLARAIGIESGIVGLILGGAFLLIAAWLLFRQLSASSVALSAFLLVFAVGLERIIAQQCVDEATVVRAALRSGHAVTVQFGSGDILVAGPVLRMNQAFGGEIPVVRDGVTIRSNKRAAVESALAAEGLALPKRVATLP